MQRRLLLTLPLLITLPVRAAAPSTALPSVRVLPEPLAMPGLNRSRTLRLCLPPSYDREPQRRYPVIYMHDGQNLFDAATSYAGEWGVDETMAQLAQDTGFEAIVVGIDNGAEKRNAEMAPYDHGELGKAEGGPYLDFVVKTVKPFIDTGWRTRPEREHTALIGSSLGGLISHAALLWHGEVFGRYGLFSPSYWAAPQLFDATAAARLPAGSVVHLYCGGRESASMVPLAQRMHSVLARQLPPSQLSLNVVADAGHNEAAWRAELPAALRALFKLG
ncbi:MAG: alpha/beta hydrolase [Burkholderiales bacterium]|jgi:predicted alpha/beta superfamily hydrolase|nr:alpha/beta hydrolase [Burkholderiales bacterium]